jgi:MoaE-MoaD fusion protein
MPLGGVRRQKLSLVYSIAPLLGSASTVPIDFSHALCCRLSPYDILSTMQVKVRYLGMLREIAGCDDESVEMPDGALLGELYAALQQRVPQLQNFRQAIALAVNYEYSAADTQLRDGDEIALIPPVSGGAPDARASLNTPAMQTTDHAAIVRQPIDGAAISTAIRQPDDGAVVVFDGIVRNQTRGRRTLYLDYTAYEPMTLKQMEQLAQQALANYAVRDVWLVHRLGKLQIGETSVYIVVASAHRAAAFDACRWLIDTLKKTVPIWKKEYFEDGAVWADGEPFPTEVPLARTGASK